MFHHDSGPALSQSPCGPSWSARPVTTDPQGSVQVPNSNHSHTPLAVSSTALTLAKAQMQMDPRSVSLAQNHLLQCPLGSPTAPSYSASHPQAVPLFHTCPSRRVFISSWPARTEHGHHPCCFLLPYSLPQMSHQGPRRWPPHSLSSSTFQVFPK